ncbi:hypothetical protein ROR02_18900 [Pararhodospirillum oryzae]|uniref:Uncharacterized protein n=1 Tax=Pararhodospirillum oryzae TaxID=478448 RepID=A0A512H8H6_9PROT|nr:hypothetical protein ROR02_18900 [Pararhodospirillum oryzae]
MPEAGLVRSFLVLLRRAREAGRGRLSPLDGVGQGKTPGCEGVGRGHRLSYDPVWPLPLAIPTGGLSLWADTRRETPPARGRSWPVLGLRRDHDDGRDNDADHHGA